MKQYFAPMEGITTYILRNAHETYYGGVDTYFTPFLANKKLNFKEKNDLAPHHNKAANIIPQILTNKSEVILSLIPQLLELGYSTINLNLGCPSGTVVSKNRGAGLLKNPDDLCYFLDDIYHKASIPISIKTRIGIESLSEWEKLLTIFDKFPIDELTIHPRLQKEFYKGTPHIQAYQMAYEQLSCPLCYNGNIETTKDMEYIKNNFPKTKAIMIGRGYLNNPSLSSSRKTDFLTFLSYHNDIFNQYAKLMPGDMPALFKLKELWTYWKNYVEIDKKLYKKIIKSKSLKEYQSYINYLSSLK